MERLCKKCNIVKPDTEFNCNGTWKISVCKACTKIRADIYVAKNREKVAERRRLYRLKNKDSISQYMRGYHERRYEIVKDKYSDRESYFKDIYSKRDKMKIKDLKRHLRKTVITGYGDKCICCGESSHQFLALDHVNSDGAHMRKTKIHPASGNQFYQWIIKNNFPSFLQLLCHNCNFAKHFYGGCPHQSKNP
jgi:hypothetical protein